MINFIFLYYYSIGGIKMKLIDGNLFVPIACKDSEKHTVLGAVAIPGEKDSDGEILTVEEVEHASEAYLKNWREMGQNHDLIDKQVAVPVQSFTAPFPMTFKKDDGKEETYPTGTWFIKSEIQNPAVWEGIKTGDYKGYSLAGIPSVSVKSKEGVAIKSFAPYNQKVLIKDLGDNWEAKMVDFVKEPAQNRANFISVKSQNTFIDNFSNFLETVSESIKTAVKGNEGSTMVNDDEKFSLKEIKEKVGNDIVSEHIDKAFKSANANNNDSNGIDLEKLGEIVGDTVNKAVDKKLAPILKKLEGTSGSNDSEEGSNQENGESTETNDNDNDNQGENNQENNNSQETNDNNSAKKSRTNSGNSNQNQHHSNNNKVAKKSKQDIADEDLMACLGRNTNGTAKFR